MRVNIKTSGFDLTEGLREHARRRLDFALDWARHELVSVAVLLSDINGPRGGKDKRCQVRIPLPGNREVVIQDTQADLYSAIDVAVERASRTLDRRLGRRRDLSIRHGRSRSRAAESRMSPPSETIGHSNEDDIG